MKLVVRLIVGLSGLVVLALVVLIAIGMRPQAGETRASVEVATPPDSAFAWVTRPDRVRQWVSWLAEVKRDTLTAAGVGSRETWLMDDPNMKQRIAVKSECTRYEPPRRVDVRVWMDGGFDGTYSYGFEPVPAGTRITMSGTARYSTWFARLMEPLITPQAVRKMNDDFATLKRLVEAAR